MDALQAARDRQEYAYFLDMGLGKSRVAIDEFCLLYTEGKCDALLVIAPKGVYTNWTRIDDDRPGELQRWIWDSMKTEVRVHKYRAGKQKQDEKSRIALMDATSPGARILVMNIEALSATIQAEEFARKFLRTFQNPMIVVDESTSIKNHKAIRSKVCIQLAKWSTWRRIMTGSPSTGSLSDFWSQFEFLGPKKELLGHRSFRTFQARYCQLRDIVVSGRTIRTEVGQQNVEELAAIVARHSFRRRKSECLDLPPKNYVSREVEITSEQQRVYSDLKRTAMAVINGTSEVTTEIVITQLMRMHQVLCGHVRTDDGRVMEISNNRVQALLDIIGETEEQVVIWAGYRPNAELIVRTLRKVYGDHSVAEWHGGVTQAMRDLGEAEFQAGKRRFMVATSAGARGRTWTAATLVIYYSNSHDLELRTQSEDRTHRIGTKGIVTYVDIMIPGTLDQKIIQALRDKRNIAHAVLNEGVGNWI